MKFYNTLNRKKEKFNPLLKGKASLYTCGPTVYDFAHIGNLRAFLFEDVLRRFLEFIGLEVLHVMNITDIDDKTIHSHWIFQCLGGALVGDDASGGLMIFSGDIGC